MNKHARIQIALLSVLCAILIISFVGIVGVSAGSANLKVYDNSTKTVTLQDGISKEKIAEVQLKTPQPNWVHVGKDVGVARIQINSYQDYKDFISKIVSIDLDTNKEVAKIYNYKIITNGLANEIKYYYVPTELENKTIANIKTEKIVQVEKEFFTPLEKVDISKGAFTLGIFTDVEANDKIEWIPTLAGVEIKEWATFIAIPYTNIVEEVLLRKDAGTSASVYGWQTKWNITSIPSGVTITNATLCAWAYGGRAGMDNDIHVGYISNQTWSKSAGNPLPPVEYANMPEIYNTTVSIFNIDYPMWGCWNVTAEMQYAINRGDKNFTLRHYDPDYILDGIGYAEFSVNYLGRTGPDVFLSFESIGNYAGSGNFETLDVTYEVTDTTPPETTIPIINSTDGTNKSSQDLNCHAILTDDKQTNLTANWTWYKNGIGNLSGTKTNIQNGIYNLITTLKAGNTSKGEVWKCKILPYDNYNYGEPQNSSAITILNSPPTHSQPLLKTLTGKNLSTEDLTCYNQSTHDADGDNVTNIYNWYKNSQPLAVLNMPFESNASDYSGYNNDGMIYGGATSTEGKIGKALSFDGVDDYVNTNDINEAEGINALTTEAWIKLGARASGVVNPVIIAKYYAWNLHINYNNNGFVFSFNDGSGWATDSVTYSAQLTQNTWYHVIGRYDGSTCKMFVNGNEVASASCNGIITTNANKVKIGQWNNNEWFNGTIDEVKIYPYALTPEQIKQRYEETKDGLTASSTITAEETTAGDNYMCQVTPNDGKEDGITNSSNNLAVLWAITFNVTSGEDGSQISNFNVNCNNSFSASGVSSPYETGFLPGSYECTFSKQYYFDKIVIFTVDADKTLDVKLSMSGQLTFEEHTMLEWLYNCFNDGDCRALLENINKTTTQVWQRLTGTDRSVIIQEKVLSYELSSTSNISINYTIELPYKEGVAVNDLLPIRMYFWFTNPERTTCYSQDKVADTNRVEAPYCLPLVAEILGPNDGTKTFQVDLRPNLPAGTYNITRSVEIDPLGVWTQYGREDIGQIEIQESGDASISLSNEQTKEYEGKGILTGKVISEALSKLSKENLLFVWLALITGLIIYQIFSSKVKKK